MARIVYAQLKGVKELNININKILAEVSGPEIENELMKDAVMLKTQLRAAARRKTGQLKDAIVTGTLDQRRTRTGNPEVYVRVEVKRLKKRGQSGD